MSVLDLLSQLRTEWARSNLFTFSHCFFFFFVCFFFNASPLPLSQGFTPDKLPPSSCTMVPELHPPSPAKKFFTKMAKSLFGKKKAKGEQAARAMGGGLVFQI